jgi:hypothetical protein
MLEMAADGKSSAKALNVAGEIAALVFRTRRTELRSSSASLPLRVIAIA